MSQPHALYRFYDDAGHLLYVGITLDPGSRFARHRELKPWWLDVRGVSIEWYDSRAEVLAAETRAIAVERPLHNISRPSLPKRVAAQACGHCPGCAVGSACDLYRPVEKDEDTLAECPRCGRTDCLYGLGYDVGGTHGYEVARDRYAPRPDGVA